ncbi:MAG: hypothetical protein M9916_09050 [Crocinitomicaceae bacterium]|nr:hypothetical protein [Crocinitomicaceae bacterium]
MNEKIQHIIQEIRNKKDALKLELEKQSAKAGSFEREMEQLKSEKELTNNQLISLQETHAQLQLQKELLEKDNAELKSLLEEAKKQVVNTEVVNEKTIDNQQIDELVREIEYCIGQLK